MKKTQTPAAETQWIREENLRLYPLVVAGDEEAIQQMIQLNAPLVTLKVNDYLKDHPAWAYLKEDLYSAGMLSVVESVRRMAKNGAIEDPKPAALIRNNIFFALGACITDERGIKVPGQTYRRQKKKNGVNLDIPMKEASLDDSFIFEREASLDPRTMTDLLDEIFGCCETELEEQVIKLRMENNSDTEVAEKLDICRTTAYMVRKDIYARFLERNSEYEGEV